jgi:uncharacterized membrane protein YfcA
MLPTFCLRLACGMIAVLCLLSPKQVNPRFYRTHFLTALGLTALSLVFLRDLPVADERWLWPTLIGALLGAFLGALSWSLDGAPGGRTLIAITAFSLAAALALTRDGSDSPGQEVSLLAAQWSSAALLGAATTAMLMGHSYLIAPAMSLTPLLRLLAACFVAILVRGAICGLALWSWTREHPLTTLNDASLLLPLRWGIGFVAPLGLGVMAWQSARIRSTQSATGILYVVVIFCFLGELISQVLFRITGLPL